MPVPTLPGTHWSAPQGFFIFMRMCSTSAFYLPLALLIMGALVNLFTRARAPCCFCCFCSLSLRLQKFIDQAYTWGCRKIVVTMFPSIFKEHKERYRDRSNKGTVTKVFVLLLDRRVEKTSGIFLRFCFCFLVVFVFLLASLVFIRYFPFAISGECLERDDKNRDLYCYINANSWYYSWDSMPVDCTTYNSTELEEIEFVCYAITIFDLGIGLAAAGSLAKLATVIITIYIRVSAAICMWSQGSNEQYCGLSAKCIYIIYLVVTLLALLVFGIISYSVLLTVELSRPAASLNNPSYIVYTAYATLPFMLLVPLPFIMCLLGKHCSQEEYISYCIHQLPDCEDDCNVHVEPESDHEEPEASDHEAEVDRLSSTPVQAERTRLVASNGNTTSYCTFTTGSIQ